MKMANKAALFSLLGLPGAGHVILKRYLRACCFLVPVVACLTYLINAAMTISNLVSEKILNGSVGLDLESIMNAISAASKGAESNWANIASMVIFVCWVVGTVDAYFLGKQEDERGGK